MHSGHEPIDPKTGSHPKVSFDHHPAVKGELYQLANQKTREDVIQSVVDRTLQDFEQSESKTDYLLLLEETLYQERLRLRKSRASWLWNWYIARRNRKDKKIFGGIQSRLKQSQLGILPVEEQKQLLQKLIRHYAEEICGHFEPKVYDLAIIMVPWFFSWLLNAISVRRFLPWGMSESLATRLRVVGEIEQLQNLSKQGTVLLVPTHLSNIDSILIGWVIHLMSLPPFAYGAGLNLFSNPFLAFSMSRLGAYTVDRQKTSLLYKTTLKNYSTEMLKRGIHSIFFPGGGRTRTGALESHLKLGLLGTALQAQIEKEAEGQSKPKMFVVPVVMSYHFVFEAPGLIEEYLEQAGKHRFAPIDSTDVLPVFGTLKFFWKLFSSKSEIYVRVGKALDVFGNFVNEQGESIGPNGTLVNPQAWVTTEGELKSVLDRDRQYTLLLGKKISERYRAENTVLSSHAVAFTMFQTLRKKYPNLDLYKFLRLSAAQRAIPISQFYNEAESFYRVLLEKEKNGELKLSDPLKCGDVRLWVEDGVRQLGLFHSIEVVSVEENAIIVNDMNLLYYYRNRLTGYGFGRLDLSESRHEFFGEKDEKGFLV